MWKILKRFRGKSRDKTAATSTPPTEKIGKPKSHPKYERRNHSSNGKGSPRLNRDIVFTNIFCDTNPKSYLITLSLFLKLPYKNLLRGILQNNCQNHFFTSQDGQTLSAEVVLKKISNSVDWAKQQMEGEGQSYEIVIQIGEVPIKSFTPVDQAYIKQNGTTPTQLFMKRVRKKFAAEIHRKIVSVKDMVTNYEVLREKIRNAINKIFSSKAAQNTGSTNGEIPPNKRGGYGKATPRTRNRPRRHYTQPDKN